MSKYDPPKRIKVDGEFAERDLKYEMQGGPKSGDPWVYHESMGLMVHPVDVMKARKEAIEGGHDVTIREDGIVTCHSRNAHKKYCKSRGFVNYGDIW